MKFISTKVHGVMDYMMGLLLIASPWIFGFASNGWETWVPVVLGITAIIYSMTTDYELGLSDNMSMRTHLTMDYISGALLAASPWLLGFADTVYLPHLILGLTEIGAALFTTTVVGSHARKATHRREHSIQMGRSRRTAHG